MAKHDVQNVSYMRKDSHFLADGTWYITTPCPICGLVDEEVAWDDAKTPHHAGLIADQRHHACNEKASAAAVREAARAEITAARNLLKQQKLNLASAKERVANSVALSGAEQEEARRNLKRHEEGLKHATKRLADTRAQNTRK